MSATDGTGLVSLRILVAPVIGAVVVTAVIGAAVVLASVNLIVSVSGPGAPSSTAVADIPPSMLQLYESAAQGACPAMPWQIVAAVGTVESDNGTSTLAGVASGANYAGAEGPMQFEPSTFAAYDAPVPPGGAQPPSPYDPTDAVWAAVRMLCVNGAGTGDLSGAIWAYNHSAAYVSLVWNTALAYGMPEDASVGLGSILADAAAAPPPGRTFTGSATAVIDAAESQLGVPYLYGGDSPSLGLDCSALVAYAYGHAGIRLPRTTFAQVDYGTTVVVSALAPGDLLFFAGGEPPVPFGHVGIYVGGGLMIEAPHTGSVVSITAVQPGSVELARRILSPLEKG